MKKKNLGNLVIAAVSLILFTLWTVLVSFVDVAEVGPMGSAVGFSTLNRFFHNLTGTNMWLYELTDLMSIIPLGTIAGFGVLGLTQWVKRKKLSLVDYDVLILGVFYAVVMAVFVLFEIFPINFRPVLIEGVLEASYPSSTTMLVMCVMPTAAVQLHSRMKNSILRRCAISLASVVSVFMVTARIISGGSAVDAVTMLKERGAGEIKFMCLVASPEGVKKLMETHPDVDIYSASLDECLNEHAYIVPGLGDAGDRIFGTK